MLLRAVVLLLGPLMAWQTEVQALGGKTLMGTVPTCVYLEGARVANNAGEYFWKIANPFDSESIFNKFGTYGNRFSGRSIWNPFGAGNRFKSDSP